MTPNADRRSLLKASLGVLALPLIPPFHSVHARTASSPRAIEDMIVSKLAEHRVPGAGIAMIEDGQVAWESGFGVKNLDSGEAVTTDTLFQAASLSKPIFAYVVMQAIERNEISLDDPLVKYDRPHDLADHPWTELVTVRDALQHTSGLPNWRADKDGPEPLLPNFEPGTDSAYSGEAYHWLQRAMEAVTQKSLEQMMRERLFAPVGLTDMRMLWQSNRDQREVYGHIFNEQDQLIVDDLQFIREHGSRLEEVAARWGRPTATWTSDDHRTAAQAIRPHDHPRLKDRPAWKWARPGAFIIDSASSLRTSAGDFARFACLMMPGRESSPGQVSEATRQLMLTPQFEQPDEQNGLLPRGFGWGLEKRPNGVAFYHWGKNGRSHISVAMGDPATRKGIVVMTNGSNGNAFIRDVVPRLVGRGYVGIET